MLTLTLTLTLPLTLTLTPTLTPTPTPSLTRYTHERRWSSTHEASPTHCDQPRADAACARAACKGGYTYPDSATAAPRGGACNPASLPTQPAAGTRYAKQGSVLLGATAKVNTEQMKQLSSSKVQG